MANADDFECLAEQLADTQEKIQVLVDHFVASVDHFNDVEPYHVVPVIKVVDNKVTVDICIGFNKGEHHDMP